MCNLTSELRRVYFNILPQNSLVVPVCDFGEGVELSNSKIFGDKFSIACHSERSEESLTSTSQGGTIAPFPAGGRQEWGLARRENNCHTALDAVSHKLVVTPINTQRHPELDSGSINSGQTNIDRFRVKHGMTENNQTVLDCLTPFAMNVKNYSTIQLFNFSTKKTKYYPLLDF